jgi:selenocysteine lyase/cysteine desulfurase
VAAAVEHLASLVPAPHASPLRRQRLLVSMAAVEAHEAALLRRLLDGVAGMPHMRMCSPVSLPLEPQKAQVDTRHSLPLA